MAGLSELCLANLAPSLSPLRLLPLLLLCARDFLFRSRETWTPIVGNPEALKPGRLPFHVERLISETRQQVSSGASSELRSGSKEKKKTRQRLVWR